jgi:hypothetical protein
VSALDASNSPDASRIVKNCTGENNVSFSQMNQYLILMIVLFRTFR